MASAGPGSQLGLVFFTVCLAVAVACLIVLLTPIDAPAIRSSECFDVCKLTLVETIPENVTFPDGSPVHMDTHASWLRIIEDADSAIDIGSSYWTLRGEDVVEDPSAWKGENIFKKLLEIGKSGRVHIRIAQNNNNNSGGAKYMNDTQILQSQGAAEVRTLDFMNLKLGGGIMHAKLWLADNENFYVGSTNLDWRALTQVKELGIMVSDCPCMARDLQKVFTLYWMLGKPGATIPSHWPAELETDINMGNPMVLKRGGLNETMYISVAPPFLLPQGRTADIDAVLTIINSAQEFIYIALMDYFPFTFFLKDNIYWPFIDDRLRAAAFERGVRVRLMPAWWRYSREEAPLFLESLQVISPALKGSIEVKLFEVPIVTPAQEKIPYSRVNHNKYMVTENTAFIGTSDWYGDCFINIAGLSIIVSQTKGSTQSEQNIHVQLRAVFDRDWNSPYAKNITEF